MPQNSSSSSSAPASSVAASDTRVFVTLLEIDGLVLPDAERIRQFNIVDNPDALKYYIFPGNYSITDARKKGLYTDEVGYTEEFFILQALYRKVFEAYLTDTLDLPSYEPLFNTEDVPMEPVPKEEQSYYQYCSTLPLICLFLRNNLCIERLETGDLDLLRKHFEAGDYEVSEELTEMVVRTYPVVIRVFNEPTSFGYQPDDVVTSYNPGGGGDDIPNNAVVFEFRSSFNHELYDSGLLHKRDQYIKSEVFPQMQADLEEKMNGYPIRLLFDVGFM